MLIIPMRLSIHPARQKRAQIVAGILEAPELLMHPIC
jgi:hypothetical protein